VNRNPRSALHVIEVRGLVKRFGPQFALRGVDLEVAAGEFVSVVGPNGAGKTTLLRVLATLSRPTAGEVRIGGSDVQKAGAEVRRQIGFLSHRTLLYGDLTAEQNLRFYGRMYDLADSEARVEEMLRRVGLWERRHDPVRTFSRGMQQRLAIARAVLHRPAVMLLDEPYTGLDQQAAEMLQALVRDIACQGCTVVLTTHDLERGLAGCDRVVVLAGGRIVCDERREAINPTSFPDTYRALTA